MTVGDRVLVNVRVCLCVDVFVLGLCVSGLWGYVFGCLRVGEFVSLWMCLCVCLGLYGC